MKKSLKAFPLVALLLLSSCSPTYERFYVEYNLDLVVSQEENRSPISLTANELRTLIDSKSNFSLYYYNDGCEPCQNSSNLLSRYLFNNHVQFYKISYRDVSLSLQENNPLKPYEYLFNVTPNIYFFKEGVLSTTLPRNKYTAGFNVFESTLNEVMKNTYISTTTTVDGAKYFFDHNQEYLIYFASFDADIANESYTSYSLDVYSSIVYPKMSTSQYSTLVINSAFASEELYDYLEEELNVINLRGNNYAYYCYRQETNPLELETGLIDYSNEEGKGNLEQMINNHLLENYFPL